ncbi:MAG: sugar phosphate isomerase, partial [Ruminococcus sp.]|nr:sugar phosphate isomerase [Ruminococcus sp.]
PTVLCGYIPTPMDAYLFAQINNGNAVSLPLGEEYTYAGERNLRDTLDKLFSEPFGQGYPKSEVERKMQDTSMLKKIRKQSQVSFTQLFDTLDESIAENVLDMTDVTDYVIKNGRNEQVKAWLKERLKNR